MLHKLHHTVDSQPIKVIACWSSRVINVDTLDEVWRRIHKPGVANVVSHHPLELKSAIRVVVVDKPVPAIHNDTCKRQLYLVNKVKTPLRIRPLHPVLPEVPVKLIGFSVTSIRDITDIPKRIDAVLVHQVADKGIVPALVLRPALHHQGVRLPTQAVRGA